MNREDDPACWRAAKYTRRLSGYMSGAMSLSNMGHKIAGRPTAWPFMDAADIDGRCSSRPVL